MKVFVWLLKAIGVLLVAGIVAGVSYQQLGLIGDARDHPAPGRMIDIGTHRLHLLCAGPEGQGPTVLLEAGATFISTGWHWVMDDLSQDTRVCTYDRSGMGWSDEGVHPYDGHQMSDELHALLGAAEIETPVVLVGHSWGAMLGRIHFDRYPQDLAGLVMIEPADPAIFLADYAEDRGHPAERTSGIRPCGTRCAMATLAAHLGIVRLALSTVDLLDDPAYPPGAADDYRARMAKAANVRQPMAMGRYATRFVYQTGDNVDLGAMPTMAIYSTGFGSLLGDASDPAQLAADLAAHIEAWERTTALSSNDMGVRAIEGGNHLAIIGDRDLAGQVADHVREMVTAVQEGET